MPRNRAFALSAIIVAAVTGSSASADAPLQYEGVSAATTLADLQHRFGEQVELTAADPAPGVHPVSASVRFTAGHLLGRASYLDYWEKVGEQRVIRLIFAIPGSNHPGDEINPGCDTLLAPLRKSYGREPNVEEFNEENLHHVKRIWTRANQTMALDCARLPKEPLTVDRLYFECRGVCR